MPRRSMRNRTDAFTLIELLTVVAIISLLISILMPSLSRARDQAKSVHCLARLKEFGNAIAAYENVYNDQLPPAMWVRTNMVNGDEVVLGNYSWAEILWAYIYKETLYYEEYLPVLRNTHPERFEEYFICKAASKRGTSSGHYRVYLPAWSAASYTVGPDGKMPADSRGDPWASISRSSIRPRLPIMGDANQDSAAGHPCQDPSLMTSFIDAGQANEAGLTGRDGNRFSDRHYGGTNYLYGDLHAKWDTKLRERLAVDWDFNGVEDIEISSE